MADTFYFRSYIRYGKIITQDYYFDVVLLSCRTLSIENGVTDANEDEAEIKSLVGDRAKRLILMADYSKLNKVSFAKIFSLDQIDYLVTDKPLHSIWIEYLEAHQIAYLDTTQTENEIDDK